jgi:pimeloyl-ACP methyl ester carboxylesterase
MVAELCLLLRRAHVPGPSVLAGHSLGGTNAQLYAFTPQEVAGLVLVDTARILTNVAIRHHPGLAHRGQVGRAEWLACPPHLYGLFS